MSGYIDKHGRYIKGDVPVDVKVPRKQPLHDQFEKDEMVQEYKRDLVQPYLPNGKPNPEFIEALPDQAEKYGFTNKEDKN